MPETEMAPERLARAQVLRAVDEGQNLLLFGRDGVVRRLEGDSAALARKTETEKVTRTL